MPDRQASNEPTEDELTTVLSRVLSLDYVDPGISDLGMRSPGGDYNDLYRLGLWHPNSSRSDIGQAYEPSEMMAFLRGMEAVRDINRKATRPEGAPVEIELVIDTDHIQGEEWAENFGEERDNGETVVEEELYEPASGWHDCEHCQTSEYPVYGLKDDPHGIPVCLDCLGGYEWVEEIRKANADADDDDRIPNWSPDHDMILGWRNDHNDKRIGIIADPERGGFAVAGPNSIIRRADTMEEAREEAIEYMRETRRPGGMV